MYKKVENGVATPKESKPRAPPPALNPEACALVQPYKDFVGKGFICSIAVEFNPMGVQVHCTLRSDLLNVGEDKNTKVAVGDAKQRIIDKKLWVPSNRGAKKTAETTNLMPKRSLTKEDFNLSDEKLVTRALEVSKALGDTVARGRIGSLKFAVEGADTLEKWWSGASVGEKSRLLSDKKHHDSFTAEEHKRLSNLLRESPFRGSLLSSPEEEDEEEDEPEPAQNSQALVPKRKGGENSGKK